MLRFLNLLAIVALFGSAVYAYTTKYQTSYRAEQIVKTNIEIKAERDAIAVLRAEWAYMTRPARLQELADKYLPDLQPLQVTQLVDANTLPERATRGDGIGDKLDALGLGAGAKTADDAEKPEKTAQTDSAKTNAARKGRRKP